MKMLALFLALASAGCFSACQSSAADPAGGDSVSAPGTPLGNSAVRVSGEVEVGGAVRNH